MFPISLLKFSLSSHTLLLSSLSILVNSVLTSASGGLLVSILFSSFSKVLFYSFIWNMFFWSPHLGCLPVFISTSQVDLLCLLVLVKWPYVKNGVLWDPVAQLPWSPELVLQVCPLCGLCMPPWALIAVCTSVGEIGPQANWLEWLWLHQRSCCAGAIPTGQDSL